MASKDRFRFHRRVIAVVVASCFATARVYANPVGPAVAGGQASFQTTGSVLTVTNSPRAIINWQSFSIAAGETTRFIQQTAASAVLNRIVTQNPSAILGALQSNGRVFLINPNGIVFGAGSKLDVAGLVASTLNMSDSDFLAGRLRFQETAGAGSIVNQGTISTGSGGSVYLVGSAVTNHGLITTPQGETILAAGKSVELVDPGTPNLRVEVVATDHEARNLGEIAAASGRVGIYAGLITNSGIISANTVQVGKNGEIILRAKKNITLEAGSLISASGAPGGEHDGGTVLIVADDTLDMRSGSVVRVDGGVDGGNGGFLELSGKEKIALNGEFTGRAQKAGYKNGSLLLDPANITIGSLGNVGSIALSAAPVFVGTNPSGTRAYVVTGGYGIDTTITVIDTATNTPIGSVVIPAFITFCSGFGCAYGTVVGTVMSQDGSRLYLLYSNGATAIRGVDIQPGSPTENTVVVSSGNFGGNSRDLALSADGTQLYVPMQDYSCPGCLNPLGIQVLDASSGTAVTFLDLGSIPSKVLGNPVTSRLYAVDNAVLKEFDTTSNTLLTSTGVGSNPSRMIASPDGSKLYFAYPDHIETRDAISKAVLNTAPFGGESFSINAAGTRAFVAGAGAAAVVDLAANTGLQSFVTGGTTNPGIAFSASANRFYVASSGIGGNALSIFDLASGSGSIAGGAVAHTDSPGATLNLAVSSLNGAWTNVSLAATNNISINSPLASTDLPAGGIFSLTAGNDVNISAAIGSASARFAHDLTLTAGNDVNINAPVYLGNNTLLLAADASIPAQGIAPDGLGSVNIRAMGMPVIVDTLGAITATGQNMNIVGGVNTATAVLASGLFSANVAGNFTLQGGQLDVEPGGNVSATAALQANAVSITAGAAITVAGGDIGDVFARDLVGGVTATATGNASASLAATTSVSLVAPTITIRGGDSNDASACCNGESGNGNGTASLLANATVAAGTAISLNGTTITIRGGDSNDASACCNGTNGGVGAGTASLGASATLSAGTNVSLTGPTITIRGGDNSSASACCNGSTGVGNGTTSLVANASVSASNDIVISTTTLLVRGGHGDSGYACCNGYNGSGTAAVSVTANALVAASRDVAITAAGGVTIAGGGSGSASACCNGSSGGNGAATVTVNRNAEVSAVRHVVLSATSLTVRGGDGNDASACCNGSSGGVGNATIVHNATGKLLAGQDMALTVTTAPGTVLVRGGDNNGASACCNGYNNADAGAASVSFDGSATVQAGGTLTLNATDVTIRGGNGNSASACCNGSSSGNGVAAIISRTNATVSAATMTITADSLAVAGGNNNSGFACCNGSSSGVGDATVVRESNAVLSTSAAMTLVVGTPLVVGTLAVAGGDNLSASACCNGSGVGGMGTGSVTNRANASITSGTTLAITTGAMSVRGGDGANAAACCNGSSSGNGSGSVIVETTALVRAGSSLALTATSLTVRGGNFASGTANDNGNGAGTMGIDASASLISVGAMVQNVSGAVTVRGGNDANALASNNVDTGDAITLANALVQSGGMMTMTTGSLTIEGGMQAVGRSATAIGTGTNTVATQANASVIAAGDFLYTGGPLSLTGGTARSSVNASGLNSAIAQANASLMASGNKTINITGGLMIVGGSALDNLAFTNPGGAWATAVLDPGTLGLTTSGDVALTGGTVTGVGDAYVLMNSNGPMSVAIGGTTGLTITGSAGSGVFPGSPSALSISFTGGGTQNIVVNPALDTAGIATQGVIVPPPPVDLPPPPAALPPPPPAVTPPAAEPPPDSATATDFLAALITANNESTDTTNELTLLSGESTPGDDNRDRRRVGVCR